MDPATLTAITTLWKVGGVAALVLGCVVAAVVALWKSNQRDKRDCAARENKLGQRLVLVEDKFSSFQSTIASESIVTATQAVSAIDNQNRINERQINLNERMLAHLERTSI